MRRIARLEAGGIHFHLGTEIGRDIGFDELRARHDALLLATGVYAARNVDIEGASLDGVVKALDYLIASNRKGFGDAVAAYDSGQLNAHGKRVVVIGGGDTAMDCVRTAVRQGAKSVTCLYRRDRANMPGSQREVANAEEEGVVFEWLAAPAAFVAGEGGAVGAVRARRMRLGLADVSGRRAPEPEPDSDFTAAADLVIQALGFDAEDLPEAFQSPDLAVTRWGTLRTDGQTLATSLPGVFAAGDIVRGASLVVWAIREGRDVADAMHAWLLTQARERAGAKEAA
jgi:glutamate synthase (NADPH/NADH) small chain